MPAKKPQATKPATNPAPATTDERKVLYPAFITSHRFAGSPDGPFTAKEMMLLLGWKTEAQHVELSVARFGGKPKQYEFGEDYLLIDCNGDKIRCDNNRSNRPFDKKLFLTYRQEHLNRKWAGPTNGSKTPNGEVIILGQHGEAMSVQHRGTSFVDAWQMWHKEAKEAKEAGVDVSTMPLHKLWPTEPVLDCVINAGVDADDPRLVRTIDSGKTRSESDVWYTSDTFSRDGKKPRDKASRSTLSKMKAAANDLLWSRTGAETEMEKYLTHSVAVDFANRHPRLDKCVLHLNAEDGDNGITALKISTGQCAALMYLMGCSASDPKLYRAKSPPDESALDWSKWDDAETFWTLVAQGSPLLGQMPRETKHGFSEPTGIYAAKGPAYGDKGPNTRYLISRMGTPESRSEEKLAVLIKAWNVFASRPAGIEGDPARETKWFREHMTEEAVAPAYAPPKRGEDGEVLSYKLAEWPNCGEWTIVDGATPEGTGGIDLGGRPKLAKAEDESDDPDVTEQEAEAAKAEEKRKKDEAKKDKGNPDKKPKAVEPEKELSPKAKDMLADLRDKHKGKVLLVRKSDGSSFNCFGPDAELVAKITSGQAKPGVDGVKTFAFSAAHHVRIVDKLRKAGHKVAYVTPNSKGEPVVANELK